MKLIYIIHLYNFVPWGKLLTNNYYCMNMNPESSTVYLIVIYNLKRNQKFIYSIKVGFLSSWRSKRNKFWSFVSLGIEYPNLSTCNYVTYIREETP